MKKEKNIVQTAHMLLTSVGSDTSNYYTSPPIAKVQKFRAAPAFIPSITISFLNP